MADGAEFTIDLGVTGADGASAAASVLDTLASKLEIAGTEAKAAASAVADAESAYNQAENAANRAATAVEKIEKLIATQEGKAEKIAGEYGLFSPQFAKASEALAKLQQRQSEAVEHANAAKSAMNAEALALDKLKKASEAAAEKESALSKSHDALEKTVSDATAAAKEEADAQAKSVGAAGMLEGAFAKLGGPLGEFGQKATGVTGAVLKMGKSLGALGPYVAAAVLAIALATAFAAATYSIAKFGVVASDTARSQRLLSDGIAGTVEGGRALDRTLDKLADTVPQSRDELLAMAGDLAKTGLKGDELSAALEDAAVQAAKLKWGPDFAKQMLSLPNQAAKLKASLSGIFSGLKIEGLLKGMASLVALFDKNSETANALKVVFESMFQPLIDKVTELAPKAVSTFIQLEIWAMKAMIAIKPYGSVIEAIGIGFGIVIGVIVGIVAALVGLQMALMAVVALFMSAPLYAKDAFAGIYNFFASLSFADLGTQLIQGLVNGITGGASAVIGAITGIAGGAVDAAKKALGIASPSKVFAEIGGYTAEGMQQGVEDGTGDVQAATTSLVAPPSVAQGGGAGTSRGGAGITVENLTVVAPSGTTDARAWAEALRDALLDLSAQVGTAVPSGA